jgi:hypothetical protein
MRHQRSLRSTLHFFGKCTVPLIRSTSGGAFVIICRKPALVAMDVGRVLSALARVEGHGRARKPHESWAEVYGSRTHPRPRKRPCNDFEDREAHRGPSTSLARRSVTSRTMPRGRGTRQSGGAACRPALCLLHSSHEPVRPGAEAGRWCAVYGVVLEVGGHGTEQTRTQHGPTLLAL